jgi:hypothetical protein
MPKKERAALRLIQNITSLDDGIWPSISDSLGLLCKAVGLNRDKDLAKLKE